MKSSVLKTCLTAALLSSAALTGAAEVYTWKGASGNSYSDTPNRLQPKRSGVVNIRTHNVKPAVAPAVAASEPVAEQPNEQVRNKTNKLKSAIKKSKNKTAKTSWKTAKSPKSTAKLPKAHAWPIVTA